MSVYRTANPTNLAKWVPLLILSGYVSAIRDESKLSDQLLGQLAR